MKRIVGISPWSPKDNPDYQLMKEAGIEWVRETVDFPYGEGEADYLETLKRMERVRAVGLKVACVSPIPAGYSFRKELGHTDYYRAAPDWFGDFDSDTFYEKTFEMCKKIGQDTAGLVELWQVSNEMDIKEFRGRMTAEQAGRYLVASAKGLRAGNPDANLQLGINPADCRSSDSAYLYNCLYKENDGLLTYVGVDGYYGSWAPGKVQDWVEAIDFLHDLTGYPVFVNEWGYASSGGEAMPEGDRPCSCGHFRYVWRKEHSEQEQAEYVATGVRLLLTYPNCIGFLYYSWGDDGTCWYCGKVGCPSESTWGITDGHNRPKPAYYAFQENVLKYNR